MTEHVPGTARNQSVHSSRTTVSCFRSELLAELSFEGGLRRGLGCRPLIEDWALTERPHKHVHERLQHWGAQTFGGATNDQRESRQLIHSSLLIGSFSL